MAVEERADLVVCIVDVRLKLMLMLISVGGDCRLLAVARNFVVVVVVVCRGNSSCSNSMSDTMQGESWG